MTLELDMAREILETQKRTALRYTIERNYESLAELIVQNPTLAKEHGQAIVGGMYHSLFTHGYQFTGDQLKVLAHVKMAGAPIGEGDITVHFDYVARIFPEEGMYVAEFPDLPGCVTQDKTLAATKESAQEALNGYVSSKMLHGDTLPAPKYHGRKTKNVRPFKVQLTLADLVFEDRDPAPTEK